MSEIKGHKIKNLLLYYLLKSAEKIGLSPDVIFRNASEIFARDIDYVEKTFFQGKKINKSGLKELVTDLLKTLRNADLIGNFKVDFPSETIIKILVDNCTCLSMAEEAKRNGEKSCPICLIAFAGSVSTAILKKTFDHVEYETDLKQRQCNIKFIHSSF